MFRVKICGVTTAEDAALAASLGAEAVGINFYRGSKRFVPPGESAAIVEAIRGGNAVPVAVFVNEEPRRMEEICGMLGIDVVQLSGDEPPAVAGKLGLKKIKAIRPGPGCDLRNYEGYPCEAFLLDAAVPGEFGGTGNSLDWDRIRDLRIGKPWILAGGLNPGNVQEAIRLARPAGVDAASGVESAPGRKDPVLLKSFIMNAMKGLGIER